MNIAIMSHTKKQDLMVQFCTAYCGVLSKHSVCGTNATGRMVAEATGLPVNLFLSHEHGGIEQIGQRIIYNEIDMVLFFNSPQDNEMDKDVLYITRLCDQHSVPGRPGLAGGHEPQPGPLCPVICLNGIPRSRPDRVDGSVCFSGPSRTCHAERTALSSRRYT